MKPYKEQIETFRHVGSHELTGLKMDTPRCFNGGCFVKKYKVTFEEIEEPKEVYKKRLQKLWEESNNHHDYHPIKAKADKLGIELEGSRGSKAK